MSQTKYLGICLKCQKGTNYWIDERKIWLCSKDYQTWLTIKRDYHLKAVKQFFLEEC